MFREHGIPTPPSELARSPDEAVEAAGRLGLPVFLKVQVRMGGRGKRGGVVKASSEAEVLSKAEGLLDEARWGEKPAGVLVEKALEYDHELFIGITVEPLDGKPVLITSSKGGVDVEEAEGARCVVKLDPLKGLRAFEARRALKAIGLRGDMLNKATTYTLSLYEVMRKYDAQLVEVNPLAVLKDGSMTALDARINVDDDAIPRHPELLEGLWEEGPEAAAARLGLSYVRLDGEVGLISSGAGLGLATLDLLKEEGASPASFLDTGGGVTAERAREAMKITLSNPRIKAVLVNIYAGVTKADEAARGLVEALKESGVKIPVVVKLRGNFQEEAWRILEEAGVEVVKTPYTREAVKLMVGRLKACRSS